MIVHLALFGARRAGNRAIGAVLIRATFHRLYALPARCLTFSAQSNTLFHPVHSFAGIAAFSACFGAGFAVFDTFLHRDFHLHAAFYAASSQLSPVRWETFEVSSRLIGVGVSKAQQRAGVAC